MEIRAACAIPFVVTSWLCTLELLPPWIYMRYMHIKDQQLLLLQTGQICKIIFDLQSNIEPIFRWCHCASRQHSVLRLFQPKASIALIIASKYYLVFCISTFQMFVDYYSLVDKDINQMGRWKIFPPKYMNLMLVDLKKMKLINHSSLLEVCLGFGYFSCVFVFFFIWREQQSSKVLVVLQ